MHLCNLTLALKESKLNTVDSKPLPILLVGVLRVSEQNNMVLNWVRQFEVDISSRIIKFNGSLLAEGDSKLKENFGNFLLFV